MSQCCPQGDFQINKPTHAYTLHSYTKKVFIIRQSRAATTSVITAVKLTQTKILKVVKSQLLKVRKRNKSEI